MINNNFKLQTPVLFLVFNRLDTTKQVFEAIRQAKPPRFYIASDGARENREGESEKVQTVRDYIISNIDWDCEVKTLFREKNLGCRIAVSSAIDWFFNNEEEGIILEDDCVPHCDFFPYCQDMLSYYRHDTRIMSICGSNFQDGHIRGDGSYYFSIHGDSWGWATWRRAWKFYDNAEKNWINFRDSGAINDVFFIPDEKVYWREILDRLFVERASNSWAYQWWLACWMNNGLSIWPNTNLITNIGCGIPEATHTQGGNDYGELSTSSLNSLSHPSFIIPNREADAYAFYNRRSGKMKIMKHKLGVLYYPYRFFNIACSKGLRRAITKTLLRLT